MRLSYARTQSLLFLAPMNAQRFAKMAEYRVMQFGFMYLKKSRCKEGPDAKIAHVGKS